MADTSRDNRPLSPFMIGPIYRPQINSIMSIAHRITGLGLALAGILVVWWFLAAASSPGYFGVVDGLMTSWIGGLILILAMAALWYHCFSGIRHLVWDTGEALEVEHIKPGSIAVLAATGVMTLLTLIISFF
jgi:succinate dehydrogenase / fumarate reductase, cytochrome b subunit